MHPHRWIATTAVAALAAGTGAATARASCGPSVATPVPQPSPAHLEAAGLSRFPFTGEAGRVDLVAPPFSNSTTVTNPLFPIGALRSAILNGQADGRPLKIETTLLPDTRVVEWSPGQCVRTLVSQFVAYRGGRIQEVALDLYAQADDGSVWYFGEDVFNYERGVVADTAGSWLAGKEGPAAMIMPGQPKVGDVLRPENIPGLVFEEVTVRRTGVTVNGPRGPVPGAIVGGELHDDGSREDKYFAPGYGEFRSAGGGDVEAMALAVPTDAATGPEPPELGRMLDGADAAFAAAGARRWRAAASAADRVGAAWRTLRGGSGTARRVATLPGAWRGRETPARRVATLAGARRGREAPRTRTQSDRGVPPRLVAPMTRALAALDRAVAKRRPVRARHAALAVTDATLDLQLRYRPPAEIDRARFKLWARRALIDARAGNRPGLSGDVATLTWIRDRFAREIDTLQLVRIDRRLAELQADVADRELDAAARTITALLQI
jgi:hypothetical protein